MTEKHLYVYNNLINFTRNKELYKSLSREDRFSDRLTLFLLHFAFFLKNFKNEENKIFYRKSMILILDNSSLVLEK
jgi:cytochrome b pre-mRNA-processing protein 3